MKIQVKLFAIARQLAGSEQVELDLHERATVADLRAALIGVLPDLHAMVDQLRFAVNSDYVDDAVPISEADEIACIPPVSGG